MSEMALGMAHGIRNPLHIIGGFSHRLVRKTDDDDPTRALGRGHRRGGPAHRADGGTLRNPGPEKDFILCPGGLECHRALHPGPLRPEMRAKNITLVTEFSALPLVGRYNKHLLKVALAHLLRNAVEASPPRGTLLVKTSMDPKYAVLQIQDTGRGIPPDAVDKVFVPFYTTKIGGTGLGMVFVRQIVDEHRGVITLESKVGRGTLVTIRLPHRFADTPEMSEEAAPPEARNLPKELPETVCGGLDFRLKKEARPGRQRLSRLDGPGKTG